MKYFLLLLLGFFPVILSAQIEINGIVEDSRHAIEFATVTLHNGSNEYVIGAITSENGAFKFSVNQGKYKLTINYIGYKQYQSEISVTKNSNLGIIQIETNNIELDELVLQTKKHILVRKNDRLVFNIENTTTADAGSAIEVLSVTPGLILNNDQLSMLGKTSINVMVDGRITPFTGNQLNSYLNSIPSNTIKSIEVITAPPSKYNAEGNGGLINIILKQNKNNSWNSSIRLSGTERYQSSWDGGATFNYKKDKLSISANVGKDDFNKKNIYHNKTFYPNQNWVGDGSGLYQNKGLNSSLSIDYQALKFWTTGVDYSNSFSDVEEKSNNLDKIFTINNELEFSIKSVGRSNSQPKRHSFNFHNIFALDSLGKKISIDMDFYKAVSNKDGDNGGITFDRDNNIIENPFFSNQTTIDYDFNNLATKIDVELPLKTLNLEFGASSSLSETINEFDFFNTVSGDVIFDLNQSNKFKYNEKIFAVYASGDSNLTKKWSLKAGLRIENTWITSYSKSIGQENKNDYLKFFPTIYSTYKFNDIYSLTASFNKRLSRPRFESLDPFKIVINPFKIVEGNPFLRPSYTDNYEFIFNSKKNELKGYFQDVKGKYEQIAEIDAVTTIVNYTYLNYLNMKNYGLTDTYIYDKIKWLTSYNTFDIGYSIIQSSIPKTINKQEGYNAFLQTRNDITLNSKHTFLMGFSYYYVFPSKVNVSQAEGYGSLNLSLKLRLLDKNLSLSFFMNDVLDSNRHLITTYYGGVKSAYKNYYDSRSIRVSAIYSFGNKKIKLNSRPAGNQDIQNRL
ncbi:outer membrane beta-barrel protein [Flavobacterium sp. ZS1P70]|uniref:Outer membrane beta-barrel protein n=1 Tax=Flavobacterium zhoui TaxID=3230414 RepID=A0ABW6I7J6_9FLAO